MATPKNIQSLAADRRVNTSSDDRRQAVPRQWTGGGGLGGCFGENCAFAAAAAISA